MRQHSHLPSFCCSCGLPALLFSHPIYWVWVVSTGVCAHRPFGTFVLHTGTGSLVCREPNEVLQMLYLTMVHQSTVVGTRPLDAVDEHFIGRYRVSRCLCSSSCQASCMQSTSSADVGQPSIVCRDVHSLLLSS